MNSMKSKRVSKHVVDYCALRTPMITDLKGTLHRSYTIDRFNTEGNDEMVDWAAIY